MGDFGYELKGNIDFKKITQDMSNSLRDKHEQAGLLIERAAKQKAPVGVSGLLRSSITHEVIPMGGMAFRTRVFVPISTSSGYTYAKAVEEGTPPHWMPWRGSENTWQLWARRKGIEAGALWHSIGLRGTKAHPFLVPAANQVLSSFSWKI